LVFLAENGGVQIVSAATLQETFEAAGASVRLVVLSAFYGGLGERESVAAAYKQGRAAISLGGSRDGELVHLKVRNGVDASQIVLAADPP
jgi:hypothetical protein